MKLPEPVKATIRRFAEKYPLPASDDQSRVWTHRLAEQLAWSHPSDGWGHKAASTTRPHSADVVAIVAPFVGWDVVYLSGTTDARLSLEGDAIDLTTPTMQVFEPVVATNHLSNEPEPPPPPADDLEVRVRRLEADVAVLQSALRDACTALERI